MKTVPLGLVEPCAVAGANVVTAAAPAAARVGLEVLRAGGNAFDAAVAACAMETVWLPMKCGLAGDLVALVVERNEKIRCLISIGAGVEALARGGRLERIGPRSVGVPGAPSGYAELARLGRFSLCDLVEPAACQAEQGLHWLPYPVALTAEAAPDLRRLNRPVSYLPNDALPVAGAPLRLPGLARVLRIFAKAGGALFRGEIGQRVVERLKSAGGLLEETDLRQEPAEWCEPASLDLAGSGVLFATPFPTHGALLAKAVECLARSDGNSLNAFREARTTFKIEGGGGTSVVTASDRDGNAVVVVHSNSFPQYGSCVVVEELDLVLNNRPGRGFSLDEAADHWNAPKAGRRPFTTLNAWALRDTSSWWLGATPGGVNQVPWNLQVVSDWLAGERDPGRLVTNPRWSLDSRGEVRVEEGHPDAPSLAGRLVPALSQRSAEQILCLPMGGERKRAAADPRTGAMALAGD